MLRSASPEAGEPLTYLAMSAGGQWVSFGAGFLNGWSARPPSQTPRPIDLNVVTGVSAGAVLAPLAFLGSDYDHVLKANLGSVSPDDIYDSRGLSLLYSNSLLDTAPLAERMYEVISPEIVRAIGDAADNGRVLLVGATDLKSGVFQPFNLTWIASRWDVDIEDRRRCITEAVMASAAIPVAFPPRFFDQGIYVDGGARQHIFLAGFDEAVQRLALRIPAESTRTAFLADTDVYMIVNGTLGFKSDEVENGLLQVAGRTVSIVLNEGLRQSLYRTLLYARDRTWNVRVATGDGIGDPPENADTAALFDPVIAAWLFAYGRELAGDATNPWRSLEDVLEDLDY